ncbi:DNA repair protein RecO [Winogradskyella sp. PC-19]|uniref:DNA repair protein RecO n=1 Tax=unclassified Winogradskyella TaxID=2615021 RepID=UPI000B3C5755|nr:MULTISPECIES: DNA repair protein RecO [unclassified Winogradskyella]ARV09548.1 DNA repair protein RecO [Winogradskyella sp. PC-19]RZN83742.1 MAG: DNA repair protein RecO [Winogradskyella sp.]
MIIKSHIIILSKIKYKDYDLIVRAYTKHRGAVSYLVKGGLKSTKASRSKSVYFQPLMQLSVEENYKPNQSLQYLKDIKLSYIYKTLHTNVYKSAIVLFLSELLSNILKEEEQNEDLFHFIEIAFQYLDNDEHYANFHILFLLKLSRYLGFQPDDSQGQSNFFNLQSGSFEAFSTGSYSVSGKNLTLLKQMQGINFDALSSVMMNAKERQDFLSMLLLYFELHLEGFKRPKSLTVLSEVFR